MCEETVLAPFADGLNVAVTVVLTEPRFIRDLADRDSFTDVGTIPAFLTDTLRAPSVIFFLPAFLVILTVSVPFRATLTFRRTDPDLYDADATLGGAVVLLIAWILTALENADAVEYHSGLSVIRTDSVWPASAAVTV